MGGDRTGFFLKAAKKRTTFGWLFFIAAAVFGKGSNMHIMAGIPFIFIGTAIRVLSSGTIKKNRSLTTTGPYGFCRHPLYLGSFFISAGFIIASFSLIVLLYFLVLFPASYIPAMLAEESFLSRKFGEAYSGYKKSTPLFVPKFKKTDMRSFSWRQVSKNKEHFNIAAVIATIAILLIKANLVF